jgi:membrane protein implicated in regulation of membrane protease activity
VLDAQNAVTVWIVLGIMLLTGEMLTGSFFLIFISLGAFAAALIATLGLPVAIQFVAAGLVSIVGVLTLRKPIQTRLFKSISLSADIGQEILVDQAIAPNQRARITYQGTSWQAANLGSQELKQGDRVVIVGIDGNTLLIRKSE